MKLRTQKARVAVLTSLLLLPLPGRCLDLDKEVAFHIPAQDLSSALIDFSRQTRLQVIVSDDLTGQMAQSVDGRITIKRALSQLLDPAGLQYRVAGETSIAVGKTLKASDAQSGATGAGYEGSFIRLAQVTESETRTSTPSTDSSRSIQIEEVVVTAQKRQERAQDIPISIAVIGAQEIERRGLIGMEDYLRSIPGVNQIDQGPTGNAIVIRGITTSPEEENFSSGTTVATYFGETPITGAGGLLASGIDVRPADIERIEVLRGPQGTAFGSASLGGTLRIIPAMPKLDAFTAKVAANYSNTSGTGGNNSMMQAVLNAPVVEGVFALRATGYRYDESGFFENVAGIDPATIGIANGVGLGTYVQGFTQDDVGRAVSTGGRLAALWQPTDRLNLSLNYLTQTIEQDGVPAANDGGYRQVVVPIAPQGRIRGEPGEAADTDIDLVNLIVNYHMDWATVTSAVSWVDSGSVRNRDLTRVFRFPNSTTLSSDFDSLTAEARLASQFDGPWQFLAGVFYEDTEDKGVQTLDWPGTPQTSPAGTNPMAVFDLKRQLEQRAVFGEISYALTDQLKATIGGRFFDYDKNETQLTEGGFFGTPLGTGVPTTIDSSESNSSYKANLSYEPNQDTLLYVSWAEGFRLGRPTAGLPPSVCDVNGDGLVDGTGLTLESTRSIDSDFLENYEMGGKFALFGHRMTIDTAAYHIKWDGMPIRALAPCNQAYVANVGAATSDGVELQVSLYVSDGLRLDFGGGYNHAELSEDAPGLVPPAFEGDRLPGSPKVSANLAAQYDFDVAGYKTFVRIDSLYAGKFYGDFQESPTTSAGDYIKVDARAGVVIRDLNVELFIRNLTNEDAFTWRGISSTPTYSSAYQLRPRTIGLQLGYQFD